MKITFHAPRGDRVASEKLLAEAEIEFSGDSELRGLKLVGFCIWRGDREVYATFPGRAFGAGSERRYFDYVRPVTKERADARGVLYGLKRRLVEAYENWVGRSQA